MPEKEFLGELGLTDHTQHSIWAYSEKDDLLIELIGGGKDLAAKKGVDLTAVVFGNDDRTRATKFLEHGAKNILLVEDRQLSSLHPELICQALANLAAKHKPLAILIGSTKRGKEIAARVATRLKTGCANDCKGLWIDDTKGFIASRIAYGGYTVETLWSKSTPFIVTISQGFYERPPRIEGRTGLVITEKVEFTEPKMKIMGLSTRPIDEVDLRHANVVVSAGRGFRNKEDLKLAEELASALGGAFGGSRPLTEDYGWLPKERQVGLSGVIVKPRLYIAVGISGQIQHIIGMRDSKIVVAVNKDANAPIFQHSDYYIVGDLYTVLPEMTKLVFKHTG